MKEEHPQLVLASSSFSPNEAISGGDVTSFDDYKVHQELLKKMALNLGVTDGGSERVFPQPGLTF